MSRIKRILTIAGSDSGGGAGVQADLKTITVLGGFGMSAITALTAQNTLGVQEVQEVAPEFVGRQIDSVVSDIGVDAIKTGMLANPRIVNVVSRKILEYKIDKVVVDPLMVAKDGVRLLPEDAQGTIIDELIPLAYLVTPNIPEATALSGVEIDGPEGMREAAKRIHRSGARNVLVKGGHLLGRALDILFDGRDFYEYETDRINVENTHGTGCTYSAAVATFLAQGEPIQEAVRRAKEFITTAIRFSLDLGGGYGPVNHYAPVAREIHRYRLIQDLKMAIRGLKGGKVGPLIPEVQSNLGAALPWAQGPEDVAAFPGRIVRLGDSIATVSDPEFGASRHISEIILTVMRYNPEFRSAMNIRYSPETVEHCERLRFVVGSFDRRDEPRGVKEKEGSSLEWGVSSVLRREERVPDIIYDEGDWGKEPMIRVLGRNPSEVVDKVLKISGALARK